MIHQPQTIPKPSPTPFGIGDGLGIGFHPESDPGIDIDGKLAVNHRRQTDIDGKLAVNHRRQTSRQPEDEMKLTIEITGNFSPPAGRTLGEAQYKATVHLSKYRKPTGYGQTAADAAKDAVNSASQVINGWAGGERDITMMYTI